VNKWFQAFAFKSNLCHYIEAFREVVGPLDPEIARVLRPDSLRAKFGFDKVRNAVHCTDLPEDGALETHYFFKILQEA
jgi:nucleoside-diphosphate kinase